MLYAITAKAPTVRGTPKAARFFSFSATARFFENSRSIYSGASIRAKSSSVGREPTVKTAERAARTRYAMRHAGFPASAARYEKPTVSDRKSMPESTAL